MLKAIINCSDIHAMQHIPNRAIRWCLPNQCNDMLLYSFQVQKRTHPETAEKILGVAYATPAPPAPLAPTAADSGSAPTPDERTKTSTASSGIAMPPTQFAEDDENTAGLPYLTKDYCLSLAPHARVMQGRQNCK
jgi:hypothetical protein